jgi:bifunctional N-acetylglucosamine-1-phosphate-uridyltransferase/glucosamine-1-phosphate-acetyltransferase GlmU-like protein
MIIPAAGLGTRLQAAVPKALFAVDGKPLLDYLLELYAPVVEHFVVVLHPAFEGIVRHHCKHRWPRITIAHQHEPTGMLDAILAPLPLVRAMDVDRVWITWCDQIAIHSETVRTLKQISEECPKASLIFPTARRTRPYIHLLRQRDGRIVGVLHRREGDAMPDIGESDMGLFSLSRDAYLNDLVAFSGEAERATRTRERNFLPFIPWLACRETQVLTFACRDEREAIGINTAQDVADVEQYLRERTAESPQPE